MDGLMSALVLDTNFAMGGGSNVEILLHKFLGPVVHPLGLRGPWVLDGWSFLTIGVSTAIGISIMTFAFSQTDFTEVTSIWALPTVKEMLRFSSVTIFYLLPPFITLFV